jgi:flagellar FliL protein
MIELNPGKKEVVTEGKLNPVAETKLMDTVLHILRSEPLDGYDAAKQDALKEKIKTEVNHELGEGTVYGVYITSFVLQ